MCLCLFQSVQKAIQTFLQSIFADGERQPKPPIFLRHVHMTWCNQNAMLHADIGYLYLALLAGFFKSRFNVQGVKHELMLRVLWRRDHMSKVYPNKEPSISLHRMISLAFPNYLTCHTYVSKYRILCSCKNEVVIRWLTTMRFAFSNVNAASQDLFSSIAAHTSWMRCGDHEKILLS